MEGLVDTLHKIYLTSTADDVFLPLCRTAFDAPFRCQVAGFDFFLLLFSWLGLGGFIRHNLVLPPAAETNDQKGVSKLWNL